MYKVDLHTHSIASPDGGLTMKQYRSMIARGKLDMVAITDHNTISFAQVAQARLGERVIIVGEEITTTEGEIIGLYLEEEIPGGMTLVDTVQAIIEQDGLVYVPHPFETVRKGLSDHSLQKITELVDIVEIRNGRAVFQNRSSQAMAWAKRHKKVGAASSDAHGKLGWGRTCSLLAQEPTKETLVQLLAQAHYRTWTVGPGIIYPKMNRLRRKFRRA